MLKLAATLAIYAAFISVSSADQAYLGEKELRDLIAGNTVHGQGLQSGTQFQSFLRLEWKMAIGTIGNLIERYLVDQVGWSPLCDQHDRRILLRDPEERRRHLRPP